MWVGVGVWCVYLIIAWYIYIYIYIVNKGQDGVRTGEGGEEGEFEPEPREGERVNWAVLIVLGKEE